MQKELILKDFTYKSKQLRAIKSRNNVWFYANDVCSSLGYKNPSKALNDHTEHNDLWCLTYRASNKTLRASFFGKNDFSNKMFVDEYGTNDLIMHSHAKNARPIQHWLSHDVIPSIVHHGGYIASSAKFFGGMNNHQIDMLEHTLDLVKQKNTQISRQSRQLAMYKCTLEIYW